MIVFRHLIPSSVAIAVSLTSAAGAEGDAAIRAREQAIRMMQRQPMIFFVAKSERGACGPGCSEWIAAEGDFDAGAAQRLRDVLVSLNGRDLPIFFNSPGGIIGE